MNSTIDGNLIYIGAVSPSVNLISEDEHCIGGATYRTSDGTVSLSERIVQPSSKCLLD